MPNAKERREIETAALNFSVGRIVMPAAITREKGGTIVDSSARPMISQTTNQIASEKRIGMRLPNSITQSYRSDWSIGVMECWASNASFQYSTIPASSNVVFEDLPYLVHRVEIILVASNLVRAPALAVNVGLDDF